MFTNKAKDGRNNLCGIKVAQIRTSMKISQKALADLLQLHGLEIDKNVIQRIECGKRFVTDIELCGLSKVFNISVDELLGMKNSDIE